jgi:hypothetical protein
MGEGNKFIDGLSKSWKDWDFLALDFEGFLGGFLIGWRKKSMRLINYVCLISRIGVEVFSLEMEKGLYVANLYGPFEERISF